MNRHQKVLRHVDKNLNGLEIGASHNPFAPKSQGYQVDIIDHLTKDELITKYKDHGIDLSKVEDVDFVWKGETYLQLTQKPKYYSWIIASHVIEHVPNLIGFLQNCEDILRDDGILSLVIPDKRYCFDHFRPISSLSSVIDKHYFDVDTPTLGSVVEYVLNVVSKDNVIAWDSMKTGDYRFVHGLDDAISMKNSMLSKVKNEYIDVHTWCFVPSSFRLLIHDLNRLGFTKFQEIEFFPTNGHEFYITLGLEPSRDHSSLDRMVLLEFTEQEMLSERTMSSQTQSSQIEFLKAKLDKAHATISGTESSKSWLLRNFWFFIKKLLRK